MDISAAFGAYGIQHKESFRNGQRLQSEIEFLGEESELPGGSRTPDV